MELIVCALLDGGVAFEVIRIESLDALHESLEVGGIDVILSDFALPGFDGLVPLRVAREVCPDVPFILVSGEVGEETAIELLKNGATDYVLKHRLERLPSAVTRAVQEARKRTCRHRAQLAVNVLADVGRTLGASLDLGITLPKHDQTADDDVGWRRLRQLGVIVNATDRMTHLVDGLL